MSQYTDKLIYGKNQTERITSIEIMDDKAIIFREDMEPIEVANKFWILSKDRLTPSMLKAPGARMKGDLHYKWGYQFTDREAFLRARGTLKNRADIWSIFNNKEGLMIKDGFTSFKGMKPEDISILSFDIETTGLDHDENSKVLMISNTFRKKGKIIRKLFCYDEYKDEGEMLKTWCEWVRAIDPSVVLGHNIYTYDLPYMCYVAAKFGVDLVFGRDESPISFDSYESKFRKDATQFIHFRKPHVFGREVVDTMFVSIRYDSLRNFPSYGLKQIVKYLVDELESKKKHKPKKFTIKDQERLTTLKHDDKRVFYDAAKIRDNYKDPEEMKKIKAYAEYDADDSLNIYDIFIPPFFYMSQMIPKSFQELMCSASGSQINAILVRSYLQEGHSLPKSTEIASSRGAISFAVPGIYRNVWKLDVSSLYPSIIRSLNLYDKQKDPEGNFLKLTNVLTDLRLLNKKLAQETKEEYYENMSNALKILINSIFGFTNAKGLLFNAPWIAETIMAKGREILGKATMWSTSRHIDEWIKEFKEKSGKSVVEEITTEGLVDEN